MFVLAAAMSVLLQPVADPSLVELTRHSSIVFSGTVERQHASTIDVPEEETTAIVRVEEVLAQPEELISLEGKRVTARFGKGMTGPGQQALFFTTLYSAGRSVGVDVVGLLRDVPPGKGRALLAGARETILDEDIARRVAQADLIVFGTVHSVRRFDTPRLSEHDPEIAVGDISVETLEKGAVPKGKPVQVWFASSDDALFHHWPKLREGQTAIFIAHADDPELRVLRERSPRAPDGPYVVDRADVLPPEMMPRIRAALQRGGKP